MKLINSPACKSLKVCGICRDVEQGVHVRLAISAKCEDVEGSDFECPLGYGWIYDHSDVAKTLISPKKMETACSNAKECGTCDYCQDIKWVSGNMIHPFVLCKKNPRRCGGSGAPVPMSLHSGDCREGKHKSALPEDPDTVK